MKKALALILALTLVVLCGCSGTGKAATPEPTLEPTPEPVLSDEVHTIPMSGALVDVLGDEERDFFGTLKSNPPSMAVIFLDGQYPLATELDIDTVRDICTALTEQSITAKTNVTVEGADNKLTLVRESGQSATVCFNGDNLVVGDDIYVLEDAGELWSLLRDSAKDAGEESAENAAALESGDIFNAEYDNEADEYIIRVVSAPAVKSGENDGDWQTVEIPLSVTNVGQHLLMSAKLVAKYVDSEGRVLASVPVDLDFNEEPVYIGQMKECTISQKLYNAGGVDLSGDAVLAAAAIIEVVSANAPNEAGH